MSELGFYALKDIVRMKDNKDSLLPISRSTWLRGIESGEYPKTRKNRRQKCVGEIRNSCADERLNDNE